MPSFDMGGTTAKVCLIEDGEPRTSRAFEVGRTERFIEGSGLPVTRSPHAVVRFRCGRFPERTRPGSVVPDLSMQYLRTRCLPPFRNGP